MAVMTWGQIMETGEKVELLAPAGNYQALLGALNAGADAVYLGGDKFGARAYADNFTKEEICKALRHAHFWGKRIYLTVNTLVKEEEFAQLYDYLLPLYEAGLDGVIIQDLGVWQYIRKTFPDMPLHASTQMTITGEMGAAFLEEIGAQRIVPARELSLTEIRQMKEQTGLELECFIHGAMCYCYSGQCLFSSILGGRSGNRGRCAQPCRLPYKVLGQHKKAVSEDMYPLSLKDMCTIEYIPQLIEAGIDSFKIEGRMKKPEYAAGVTAIYRKYIDAYYANGAADYHVAKSDMDKLRNLYIRSEIQTGYYERHNGREMITLHKPSYLGSDDALLQEIAGKYLTEEKKMPVTIRGIFRVGEPAVLQIEGVAIQGNRVKQTSYGEIVQQATGKPMEKEALIKRLSKTGNSNVIVKEADIEMDGAIFMPIGQLNELRRNAVEAFENKIIEAWNIVSERKMPLSENIAEKKVIVSENKLGTICKTTQLHASVQTFEQLQAIFTQDVDRIYLDSDLYLQKKDQIDGLFKQMSSESKVQNVQIYLALPYIVRAKDKVYLQKLSQNLSEQIQGFLVRNLESASFVKQLSGNYDMVTDVSVYQFNKETALFWSSYSKEGYLPYELNGREYRRLLESVKNRELSMVVYGTIPMMITANCLKKTTNSCIHNGLSNEMDNRMYLQDRYKTIFPVMCNCKHCYNIIYNSIPFSLHKQREEIKKAGLFAMRMDFVQESGDMVQKIIGYYQQRNSDFPITEYTTGHYKRGVE